MSTKMKLMCVAMVSVCVAGFASEPLTLDAALKTAYSNFPRLSAQKDRVNAAESEVTARVSPSSPSLGISQLNRGNSTTYATIEQKIDFPTKYILKGKAQSYRANAEMSDFEAMRLFVRANVISTFYELQAVQKIIELNQQDLARLKEMSRITESKYASGKAPQHDQMKAHVAQTETETKLIVLRQEEDALQAKLAHFLHGDVQLSVSLAELDLEVPDIRGQLKEVGVAEVSHSPVVAKMRNLTKAAEAESSLAGWNFAPDFKVSYQQRIAGAPENSHIVGVNLSIPLWFWGNSAESRAASYRESAAKKELMHSQHKAATDLRMLKSKLMSEYELYRIFESSLIPQALSSYNSAIAAYRANRISFNDYLDSERSLLQVKIARFRTRSQYIGNLVQFEALLGKPISGLGESSLEKESNDEKN